MALDFQYLEIDGVEFDTYWQNGGYKKISDIIFAEWHIFIVSNLCHWCDQTFSAVITKRCAEILPNWIFFTKHVQIPRFEMSGCVQSL